MNDGPLLKIISSLTEAAGRTEIALRLMKEQFKGNAAPLNMRPAWLAIRQTERSLANLKAASERLINMPALNAGKAAPELDHKLANLEKRITVRLPENWMPEIRQAMASKGTIKVGDFVRQAVSTEINHTTTSPTRKSAQEYAAKTTAAAGPEPFHKIGNRYIAERDVKATIDNAVRAATEELIAKLAALDAPKKGQS